MLRSLLVLAVAVLLPACACSKYQTVNKREEPKPTKPTATEVKSPPPTPPASKTIRLEGTARNTKLAPSVSTKDHGSVYCLGHPGWADGQIGKPVTVEGVLETTDEFMAKGTPPGPVSAGTDGEVTVLRGCKVITK